MTTWTVAGLVEPAGADAGQQFWAIENDIEDNQHVQHWPTKLAVLNFLIAHKMKMGDSLVLYGPDDGQAYTVELVKHDSMFTFDVGGQELPTPQDLIAWLDETLQPGDSLAYLPS